MSNKAEDIAARIARMIADKWTGWRFPEEVAPDIADEIQPLVDRMNELDRNEPTDEEWKLLAAKCDELRAENKRLRRVEDSVKAEFAGAEDQFAHSRDEVRSRMWRAVRGILKRCLSPEALAQREASDE